MLQSIQEYNGPFLAVSTSHCRLCQCMIVCVCVCLCAYVCVLWCCYFPCSNKAIRLATGVGGSTWRHQSVRITRFSFHTAHRLTPAEWAMPGGSHLANKEETNHNQWVCSLTAAMSEFTWSTMQSPPSQWRSQICRLSLVKSAELFLDSSSSFTILFYGG